MPKAERDDPIEPEPAADPRRAREKPQELDPAAVSPENARLLQTIADLTARLAERDAQLTELIGAPEWLALRSCDRGGYTTEAVRGWCKKGLVLSRREGTGKRAERIVNTLSLAARLAQKGLSKAIKRR